MLAGTLADYKESEKIPSDIACTIESMEDTVVLAHAFKGDFDLSVQKQQLYDLTESIIKYFAHKESEDAVFAKIDGLTSMALLVEQTRMGSTTSWIKREQTNLRKLFARTTVIKRTHFISTGYAFLEVLTMVIIGLLLISVLKFCHQYILIVLSQDRCVYGTLIKDIDHPLNT